MKLNRNDELELRERILNMTPDERKKLGINKSTLWYIKKNLSEGKTPKIYEKNLLKIQIYKKEFKVEQLLLCPEPCHNSRLSPLLEH